MTGYYEQIYGAGIDLSSSSQDGQMMRLYVQAQLDCAAILVNDYNSRDANTAIGTQLDTLFWGIPPRQGGTLTIYPITVTVTAPVTLWGLDQSVQPVDTIQDPNGNQYQLQTTVNVPSAGSYIYDYQAANPGNVTSALNTITTPVTVHVPNVTYNNPTAPTVTGANEETDFAYRMRGLASTAEAGQGFIDSMYAALASVPKAAQVKIYENPLGTVSPNSAQPVSGVPAHGFWAIVNGSALPSQVAQQIYNQRSIGSNMKGTQSYTITRLDGTTFTVYWDNVSTQDVFLQFTATSIDGINLPNIPAILAQLPALINPAAGATLNINEIGTYVQEIDPNTLVTGAGLSTSGSGPFTNTLTPSGANIQFAIPKANITITPPVLLPATSTVAPTANVNFTAYGGTQSFTYAITTNNSGGSIVAGTGVYTAGSTPGTDTITATDTASNTATATVTVT